MSEPKGILFTTSQVSDGNMSFRIGNTTSTLANRQTFLTRLGLTYNTCAAMLCDHGNTIQIVDETFSQLGAIDQAAMPIAEALLTNSPNVSLLLLTADCIPAVLYDPVNHAVALAHLNRKTIAHQLTKRVVEKMTTIYKSNPTDLLVWFEPHIHHQNYRFKLPLISPLIPELKHYSYEKAGYIHINFAKAHFDELVSAGLNAANISTSPIDVYENEHYFSHTAFKHNARPEGRHATTVSLAS